MMRKRISILSIFVSMIALSLAMMWVVVADKNDVIFTNKGVDNYTMSLDSVAKTGWGPAGRKGLKISTTIDDAQFTLNQTQFGDFSLGFRVMSRDKGTGAMGGSKADFGKLKFHFIDKADINNTFSIVCIGIPWWGGAVTRVAVNYDGITNGLEGENFTAEGAVAHGSFEGAQNPDGYPGDEITKVLYNASTKQVGVYINESIPFRLVKDLDDPSHVGAGNELKGMEEYTVVMELADRTSSDSTRPSEVIVYEINGDLLSGNPILNQSGPSAHGVVTSKGVKDKKYKIPSLNVADLIDGDMEYAAVSKSVKVTAPSGNMPSIVGDYVTFDEIGEHRIEYTLSDKSGMASTYNLSVMVVAENVKPVLTLDKEMETLVAKGNKLLIPKASATSELSLVSDSIVTKVTLKRSGASQSNTFDADKDNYVTLSSVGAYEITYKATDYIGNIVTLSKTVRCEDIPYFVVTEEDSVQIGEHKLSEPIIMRGGAVTKIDYNTRVFDNERNELTVKNGLVKFDKSGKYFVSYSMEYDKNMITKEIEVSVGALSQLLWQSVKNTQIAGNCDMPNYSESGNGVKITGEGDGATVKFKNKVDLNGKTKDDELLAFQVTPDTVSDRSEFDRISLKLSDAYDEDNYITISFVASMWPGAENKMVWSYAMVEYNKSGYIARSNEKFVDDNANTPEMIKGNPSVGTSLYNSFYGHHYSGESALLFKVYYDAQNKQVWVRTRADAKSMVLDLDNAYDVGAGREWKGFKNNEVYASLTFSQLRKSTANIIVTNFAGQDMSGKIVADKLAPTINLAYDIMPEGVKGLAYPVPEYSAFDLVDGENLVTEVTIKKGDIDYKITSDNKFSPDIAGDYTIKYKATDRSGNTTLKTKTITVKDTLPLSITYQKENALTGNLGEEYTLAKVASTTGSGKVEVTKKVKLGNVEIALSVDDSFVPTITGVYSLVYTLRDYLGQTKDFVTEVNLSPSAKPILELGNPPKYSIVGERVVFPDFKAKDYNYPSSSDNFNAVKEIEVISPNASSKILDSSRAMVFDVEGSYTIKYRGKSRVNSLTYTEETFVLNVVDTRKDINNDGKKLVSADKFFVYDNAVSKFGTSATEINYLCINPVSAVATIDFINPLSSIMLNLEFDINELKNKFEYVKVILTDSENIDNSVAFKVKKRPKENDKAFKTSYINVNNNNIDIGIPGSFYGNSSTAFTLKYMDMTRTLYTYGDVIVSKIMTTEKGKTFEGFGNRSIFLKIELGGATVNDSELELMRINNQTFSASYWDNKYAEFNDRARPNVYVKGEIRDTAKIGDTINLPEVVAYDVLDPSVTLERTIVWNGGGQDEAVVIDGDTFQLNKLGTYKVIYKSVDSKGNGNSKNHRVIYNIRVIDEIKPVITVDDIVANAKVGQTISLPTAKVTDNNTNIENDNLIVYLIVRNPNYYIENIVDNKLKLESVGVYSVTYYTYDCDYNYVYKEFKITVTK